MADLQSRLTFNDALLSTEVAGECVMMNLDAGLYFTLNPVGTEIWARLKEGCSVDEVCAALAERYDAPREQIEAETLELIDRLVDRGLASVRS